VTGLDQKTIDRIILVGADSVLNDARTHMDRWVAERGGGPPARPDVGKAPAMEIAHDLFPIIQEVVAYGWGWLVANRDGIIAGMLTSALAYALETALVKKKTPTLSPDEIKAIANAIAPSLVDELDRRSADKK
jgi:hypothetical protein